MVAASHYSTVLPQIKGGLEPVARELHQSVDARRRADVCSVFFSPSVFNICLQYVFNMF